jgi:phage recombination protein Bet
MAIQNTISKPASAPATKNEVTYQANGENVKLSPATVKQYLVSGGGAVSDQEVVMFMSLCRYQHLNPFLREAYLVKYGNSPATILTGKDVFLKRANRNPNFRGLKAGIMVQDKNTGDVIEREGTFYLPTEDVVGGYANVYVKDREPYCATVAFSEYAGRKGNGELNSQWATKPATMIRKVALVQALREAFPEDFAALYAPEEVADVNAAALDETPVIVPQTVEPQPQPTPAEAPKAAEVVSSDDPEDVFFN